MVLADEVGMGKTFVALAATYCVGVQSRKGPVVVMVPPNLVDKWEQDLDAFCALYLDDTVLVNRHRAQPRELRLAGVLRYCRHVIHHDLDWNPSSIEQRTGRVDRLGCKAESCQPDPRPIRVFLPCLAGTADERQYRVMTDRERWFRIVMGQEDVARLIPNEEDTSSPTTPQCFQHDLVFDLGLSAGE